MKYINLEEAKRYRLSKNFLLSEFLKSDIALRMNIDNSIPVTFIPHLEELTKNILQPVRDEFGPIHILSGYRCLTLNRKIGSTDHSNHVFGYAADIEPYSSNISLMDILNFIHNNLDYKELIGEYFPMGWIHVAFQKENNKRELKLKDKDNNYTRVSIEKLNTIYC